MATRKEKTAGYSGTPLVKKLGIKDGFRAAFVGAPAGFGDTLGPIPADTTLLARPRHPMDFILLFTHRGADLVKRLPGLHQTLAPTGMLWVAWPKKSSGVATDLSFDVVQTAGLATGLVDVKICAIDDTWSGLKFVIRKKDR